MLEPFVPDLELLRTYLVTGQYPPECKGDRSKKANLRRQAKRFRFFRRENRFYLEVPPLKGAPPGARLVPVARDAEEIRRVLYACHYSQGGAFHGAHDGIDKMWQDVRERLYFEHCHDLCVKVCASCVTCAQVKGHLRSTSLPVQTILTPTVNRRVR